MPALPPSLCGTTLDALPHTVAIPRYDRAALVPSVVHIGVGGFHRSHQAVYFDDLAGQGETGWGVVGVGLRRPQMGEVLQAQDGLFTVVERSASGDRARVVGALVDYLYAPDSREQVLRVLADQRTRLVTLTITGGGYPVDDRGRLDLEAEGIEHDLEHPREPTTAIGYLVEALRLRWTAGAGPFTVLSCDNLPDSGGAARTAVISFAERSDPELARWVAARVSFPSSMVDRITPETSPALREELERVVGVPDRWPVVTEPFRQWVVEDDFCAGRPPLERVGVQYVGDVAPYKLVKTRLLNGGHCALGHLGLLAGHERTDQAMADPVVGGLVDRLLREEVAPLLPTVPGLDLDDYLGTTLSRFANPAIGDSLTRLCRRSSVKMPSYLLPSLREALTQGRPHGLLLLALAAWLRALRGSDLSGAPLLVDDPRADLLTALARHGADDPRPLLGARSIFGDLVDDSHLVRRLADTLHVLSRDGLEAAARACSSAHPFAA
jgi:fructuronate reductase/mannitol 2-dehydrogenase